MKLSTDVLAPRHYTVSVSVAALGDRDIPVAHDLAQDVLAVDLAPPAGSGWLFRNWDRAYGSVLLQRHVFAGRSKSASRRTPFGGTPVDSAELLRRSGP